MRYHEALNFLNSFVNYERLDIYPYGSFKLKRVAKLLQLLDNPHRSLRVIHIAGSKGKGSTCAFAANILKEAGFKVGLYTSPHLVDMRERIRILQETDYRKQKKENGLISRKEFSNLLERIKPYAERLRKTSLGRLSYFEILTILAFLYFKEKEVDFAVLETGIGGRLDATNVIYSLVCAITPVSYEHTHILGDTLGEIAREKAGIIKNREQIVVTAPQEHSALRVIRNRAKECGAVLFEVGRDIQIKKGTVDIKRQSFDVKGIFDRYTGLKIGLLGGHQILNAAVAIACGESLRRFGIEVSRRAIREGLKKTRWPGRLQIISRRPRIVIDAAHNRASARVLKEALRKFFKYRNLILVFGVLQGKDVRGILKEIEPLASRIILTRAKNVRAMAPKVIKIYIKTDRKPIFLTGNLNQALKIARENTGYRDLILISGSLYLLGEALKKVLKKQAV